MRLIDADALKEEVSKKKVVGRFNTLSLIDAAPTIIWCNKTSEGYPLMDLRPKEEGKWIIHDRENLKYGCNQCGNLTNINSNFCPNCGADMKGGAE